FSQAEIRHIHPVGLGVQKQVVRFDVAVQDAVPMGLGHAMGSLLEVSGGPGRVEGAFLYQLSEAESLDVAHGIIRVAVDFPNSVERHDIIVLELGGSLGLDHETVDSLSAPIGG